MLTCQSLSHVQLFVTLWTVARQVPVSIGILHIRILEWVAVPFSRGSSQPLGSNPGLLHCRQILYSLSHQGSNLSYNSNSGLAGLKAIGFNKLFTQLSTHGCLYSGLFLRTCLPCQSGRDFLETKD